MKIPCTFIPLLLFVFMLISCQNADFNALMELEAVVNGAAEPGVTIFFPANEEHLETLEKDAEGLIVARQIVFQGAANDGYNKPITDDASFVWRSNIDGNLGTGRNLVLTAALSPGTHRITLEVTDSYGGVDSRTVTVHYPRVFTEDFSTTTLADTANTTGIWDMASHSAHLGANKHLKLVSEYNTAGQAGSVVLSGNYAFVADGSNGLLILNISNPANPVLAGSYTSSSAYRCAVSGNYVYIGAGSSGLVIINISNPASPTLAGTYSGINAGDVAVQGNYAYVADCDNKRLYIIDVSAPTTSGWSPAVAYFSTPNRLRALSVDGNYAYLACDISGLRIVDITTPLSPLYKGYFSAGYAYGVTVAGNYAYVSSVTPSRLHVIDISNPANPFEKTSYTPVGDPGHVAVSGTYVFLTDYNYGLSMVNMGDMTSPPVLEGSYKMEESASRVAVSGDYAFVATSSQGLVILNTGDSFTFTGNYDVANTGKGITVSGNYAFLTNRGGSGNSGAGLNIIDISNPASPEFTGNYTIDFGVEMYADDVAVADNYAYVAAGCSWSNTFTGLIIVDISDPYHPKKKSFYHTQSDSSGVALSGIYAYVTDFANGLNIINISDPVNPVKESSFTTGGQAYDVALSGNYAYIADGSDGLLIVDISIPASPVLKDSYDTAGSARSVAVSGIYAYIADYNNGLIIIDVTDPANPVLKGSYDTAGNACGIAVSGNYAYVADDSEGLTVVNISTPASPRFVGTYGTGGNAYGVAVAGNYAYEANSKGLVVTSSCRKYNELYVDIQQEVRSRKVIATSFSSVRFLYESESMYQYLDIQMSMDGGTVWNSAADSLRISLPGTYSDLRWRALMRTFNVVETPKVNKVRIEYWE